MSSHHEWAGLRPPEQFADPPVTCQVRGPYAAFTRPEFTSERMSYPIMTPTAAVGLLTALFWKPQIRWVVEQIDVLAEVQWTSIRRNESGTAVTPSHRTQGFLDVDTVVQQRMTTMLRDVHYRVHAHVWVHPDAEEQNPAKWRDQFRRRVHRGQSFRTPFLGMRELHADVTLPDATPTIAWTEGLGIMTHSIDYDEHTGKETYDWFDAKVADGAMRVPRLGLMARRTLEATA